MHFNYLEMKYFVFCVTLILVFFANIVSSTVSIAAISDNKKTGVQKYEGKQALQLSCNMTKDKTDEQEVEVKWKRGDVLVTEDADIKTRLSVSHNGNIYKLQINNPKQEDAGKYACIAYVDGGEVARAVITAESHVYVRLAKDISVVEGEKLKVICAVHGSRDVTVVWIYKNTTYNESIGRVHLQNDTNNITNAQFILDDVVLEDQGDLTCYAASTTSNDTSDPHAGVVRVKDKYAALWPFLGICAEVLVLCAIIFIYEKKRNKTELEESDTDQSPEQKNTPDHGGKESNLRHRQ